MQSTWNEPKISVVIPTYNHGHFLERCLHSIQNQTRPPDEIVIVDDGSTDNTQELLNTFKENIPNLISIRQNNSGEPAARNTGLARARYRNVAFIDSDDTWAPVHIEESLNAFQLFSDAAFILASYELNDPNGFVESDELAHIYLRRDFVKNIEGVVKDCIDDKYFFIDPKRLLHHQIMRRVGFHLSTLVIDRQRMSKLFSFDDTLHFGTDVDFLSRLLDSNLSPVYINNIHSSYHIHTTNTINLPTSVQTNPHEKLIRSTNHLWKRLMYCKTYSEYSKTIDTLADTYLIIAGQIHDLGRYKEADEYFKISFRLKKRFDAYKHIIAYSILGGKGMSILVPGLMHLKRAMPFR